ELSEDGWFTVVTSSLSARIVNRTEGWQFRIPITQRALSEGSRQRLDFIEFATPCGMSTWGSEPGSQSLSTPMILVVTGAVPDWTTLGLWPTIEAAVVAGGWNLDGHPTEPCGALHCRLHSADADR